MTEQPGTRAYVAEWHRLTRERDTAQVSGTMAELIRAYTQSHAFYGSLSDKTKRSYDAAISEIEAKFCDMPIEAIGERGARRVFVSWRDSFSDTPRKADLLMTVLARICAFGVDQEIIDRNPLEKVARLSDGSRRDVIWSQDQIDAFRAVCGEKLELALDLALWTGQRQGDLLRLPWSAYDGNFITLKTGKTKRHVRFRVFKPLKARLDAQKCEAVTILSTMRGKRSWTEDGFRSSWDTACKKAGVAGVTFHDLRGTFVTLAYQNGASIREIAEITGHTERQAEAIIRKHYLAGSAAILRLEAAQKRTKL